MLGNMKDAKKIYAADLKGKVPQGWKFFGEGSYRRCYLSPDHVVYKVAKDYFALESNEPNDNDEEDMTYRRVAEEKPVVEGWRLADMWSHRFFDKDLMITVNAMEYIEGEHEFEPAEKVSDVAYEAWEGWISRGFAAFGLLDWGCENYLVLSDGNRVIVDYVR